MSDSRPGTTPTPPAGHSLLEGKTVLVTAAAGTGIGYATALRCAQEGATVAISDRHERRLGEAAERLAEETGSAPLAIPCDVTVEEQVGRWSTPRSPASAQIDVMVNNAGLGGEASILEMSDERMVGGPRRHPQRHLPLHPRGAPPHGPARLRRRHQQRLGARLARPARPGPLRRGEGRRDGADPLRGDGRRRPRRARQLRRAEHRDPREPRQVGPPGAARPSSPRRRRSAARPSRGRSRRRSSSWPATTRHT